jgi:hypothetical protein
MSYIKDFVESASDSDLWLIIKDYEQFEQDGVIGDCFLRTTANNLIEQVSVPSHNAVMVMERLAFEASMKFTRKYISSSLNCKLASCDKTSPEVLNRMETSNYAVFRSLAQNSNTPQERLEMMANEEEFDIRELVAGNPNASPKTIEKLSNAKEAGVRWCVARNPNTPVKILEQLATDEDSNVRFGVAHNPNTPVKILEQLATDEVWEVRWEVARNSNTSSKTLEQLATDENSDVRCATAKNPNTPVKTLEQLATDSHPYPREMAKKRLNQS